MTMSGKYTPMMEQYLKVKENYPDTLVFYRIGDFYEMFFDDAKIASKELDLILTGKNAGVEERVPMCGVPFHAVQPYIQRLVSRGYKVAIVEQMEDPKKAVGLVKRDVIRVITPGTVMDEISDDKASVYLGAVEDFGYGYCIAAVEASTGENFIEEIPHKDTVFVQTIMKNNIREVVVKEDFPERLKKSLRQMQVVISTCDDDTIKPAYEPLCDNLKKDYERSAYGRMLVYLEETQRHMLAHLQPVLVESENDFLDMDYSTRMNLEISVSAHPDGKGTTLWSFLDRCKSAMGSRLLRRWLEKPLVKVKDIEARYDKVQYLMGHFMARQNLREDLNHVYDLSRLIARCAMNSASPVDLVRLTKTLAQVPDIMKQIDGGPFAAYQKVDQLRDLYGQLKDAFNDEVPSVLTNGGVFRDGYNKELDEAREIQRSGQDFIASMEAKEKERTGIKTLKIGYNKVFGYYIEISKAAAKEVKPEWGYIRKQTLVNNERFISPELKEKEDAILHASENAVSLEKELYRQILEVIRGYLPKLQKLAAALAEIDVYQSMAEVSSSYGYVRPSFTDDALDIVSGRHPILDEMMKDPRYVANSVHMNKEKSILLITGPNMGGKSTYMRQTALLVVMAQAGCYVPAKEMKMPVFDKIFTRIGASDDILAGQSTFMVEMSEANKALQNATEHSLILFDEIGRGTSTYDGMALAQAMIEYIAACVHAKTMFSTHYHELTSLTDSIEVAKNVHVVVKEDNEKVTFMYKVKDGAAGHSYGVNVARLAGLPEAVIDRAKELQKELESKRRVVQQSYQLVEMEKEDPAMQEVKKQLEEVNPDDLSPRQAWQMLADLCQEVKEKK
jgi:DNA mismatch repair protein MutS